VSAGLAAVLDGVAGGEGGDLVEPLAGVGLFEAAEALKGSEELVVAADAGGGDEAAHGEGVDEGVVELLVLEGVGGGDGSFATDGRRGQAARGGLDQAEFDGIDAEVVGGGVPEEGLGIDCAGEMHVEIGALGHLLQEGV
jgi:hypothetical protein